MKSRLKIWISLGLPFLFLTLLSIEASNYWIVRSTENQIYSNLEELPDNRVGVVPGTAKKLKNGRLNYYFVYRMEAAAELYHQGKIFKILVSGDNSRKTYNEPQDMKDYLVELDVKPNDIYMDFAGFRTFDSMIRAKEVFGVSKFTFISQPFHNQRAVYIANQVGMDVVAYNCKSIKYGWNVREYLAKYKAVLDVYILGTTPKFLGPEIAIK